MTRIFRHALFIVVSLFAISANGAPVAYSVNSDSLNSATTDSLYVIDLATGFDTQIHELSTGSNTPLDTEGLAFAPDGTLWGIDDESLKLFPINKDTGFIKFANQISLSGFGQAGGKNDFGMTFSCDNTLYVSTVRTQSLHRLDQTDGSSQVVGTLDENISAIAAYGNPTRLYGLGNGQFQDGSTDSPNLYRIDPDTGETDLIGPLGTAAGDYYQGGLAFDQLGGLWAITDRGSIKIKNGLANVPSQILSIDITTGTATLMGTTAEGGFESLAIAPPSGCEVKGGEIEEFPRIPTLNPVGRLLTVFILLLTGMAILRRKVSQ